MKLTRRGTPRAVLEMLATGPVLRAAVVAKAREHAQDEHAAAQALYRLQNGGFIVCEQRLTTDGLKLLQEARK